MGRFDERATKPARNLGDILRWRFLDPLTGQAVREPEAWDSDLPPFDRDAVPEDAAFATPRRENDGRCLTDPNPSLTWVGHATFALRLGGLVTLCDPIWRRGFGPRRRHSEPGLPLDVVARSTDVVLVSHNHFDHLDMGSLRAFGARPLYIVPLGNAQALAELGANVVELDWWQSHEHQGVRYTLVPARHWSMRMPWTRNQALWGGFVVESEDGVAYHSGDTAYFEGFREIAERCPPIDWAMLPIGAYDPRWFMRPQHMCPEEAGRAFLDLGARHLVAMHWGTFKLTDEKLAEPPLRLRHWAAARGVPQGSVWIMDVGETRQLA